MFGHFYGQQASHHNTDTQSQNIDISFDNVRALSCSKVFFVFNS